MCVLKGPYRSFISLTLVCRVGNYLSNGELGTESKVFNVHAELLSLYSQTPDKDGKRPGSLTIPLFLEIPQSTCPLLLLRALQPAQHRLWPTFLPLQVLGATMGPTCHHQAASVAEAWKHLDWPWWLEPADLGMMLVQCLDRVSPWPCKPPRLPTPHSAANLRMFWEHLQCAQPWQTEEPHTSGQLVLQVLSSKHRTK